GLELPPDLEPVERGGDAEPLPRGRSAAWFGTLAALGRRAAGARARARVVLRPVCQLLQALSARNVRSDAHRVVLGQPDDGLPSVRQRPVAPAREPPRRGGR